MRRTDIGGLVPPPPMTPPHTPWTGGEALIFEPHNLFGVEIDGETMPFGYISTSLPVPVFELGVVLEWPPEALRALALKMAAAPALYEALKDLRTRFHRALILTGTDPEFADEACAQADAALSSASLNEEG